MSAIPSPQPKRYRAFSPSYFIQNYPGNYRGTINPAPMQSHRYGEPPTVYSPDDVGRTEAFEDKTPSTEQNLLTEQSDRGTQSVGISYSGQMSANPYPAMPTIKETLLLWTQIGAILFFLAGVVNIVHLWIWVHSSDYYFQHWQIILVELIPHIVYTSAICALLMYWFVMCRWYFALLRLLSMSGKAEMPRSKQEIIPLFFPLINCWGFPQVLTELLIIIRRQPQPVLRISYKLYIVTMRKIRFWSITWIALWIMTLVEVLASCLVHRPDSIALNDEFRIIWLFCIGVHICYTYRIIKVLTLLAEVVSEFDRGSEEDANRNSDDQSLDIMAAI